MVCSLMMTLDSHVTVPGNMSPFPHIHVAFLKVYFTVSEIKVGECIKYIFLLCGYKNGQFSCCILNTS